MGNPRKMNISFEQFCVESDTDKISEMLNEFVFLDSLNEVTSSVPHKKVSRTFYEANIGSDKIEIEFSENLCDLYTLTFYVNGTLVLRSNANYQKIFALVVDVILNFVETESPKGLYFKAKNEGSRVKSYSNITSILAPKIPNAQGYKKTLENGDTLYCVIFDDSAINCINTLTNIKGNGIV